MGTDTPLAVLSDRPRLLYDYFKQLFAQVTNPPLDAIREELVTSMASTIGPEAQPAQAGTRVVPPDRVKYPIIDNDQLAKLRHIQLDGFRSITLQMLFGPRRVAPGWPRALDALCFQRQRGGRRRLQHPDPVGSRRRAASWHRSRACWRPRGCTTISSAKGTRTRCALVIESGDAREVHHVALLIGTAPAR